MGYSHAALAGDPNDQAANAAVSIPECVRNYSKNLTLVALHKSEGNVTPFGSDADQPVSIVSNTDSKGPYPKTSYANCSEKER